MPINFEIYSVDINTSILRTATALDETVLFVYRNFYILNINLIRLLMVSLSQSILEVNDIIYTPLSELTIPPFLPHKNRTIDEISKASTTIKT